jgi:competence protein ComEC
VSVSHAFRDRRRLTARTRAAAAFAGFAAGVIVARELPAAPTVAWAGLGATFAAIALLSTARLTTAALAVAMLGAGGAVWSARVHDRAPDSVAASIEQQAADLPAGAPIFLEIEGIALGDPERMRPKRGGLEAHVPPFMQADERARLRIKVDAVHTERGARPASGIANVSAPPPIDIRAGQRVRVLGRAQPTGPPTNPGAPGFAASARAQGDSFWLDAGDASLIRVVDHPTLASAARGALAGALAWPRSSAAAIIDRAARDDDAGALIRGLMLGERETDGPGLAGAFRRIGLAHLLSVSGFHVAVMAFVAVFVVRATGDRGWIEPAIVAVAIALYMLVVPAKAPILRAGAMVLALLISDALGRRHDRLALLAWVGVGVLVWRPTELLSIGFQLSFGLVAWLLVIAEPRPGALRLDPFEDPAARPLWRGALGWFGDMARATAACWSVSIPLVLYHTGALAPLAIAATLITVPLIVAHDVARVRDAAARAGRAGADRTDRGGAAPLGRARAPASCAGLTRCRSRPSPARGQPGVDRVRHGRGRSGSGGAAECDTAAWLLPMRRARAGSGSRRTAWASDCHASVAARATMLDVGDGTAIVVESGRDALLWDCGSFRESIGVRDDPRCLPGHRRAARARPS